MPFISCISLCRTFDMHRWYRASKSPHWYLWLGEPLCDLFLNYGHFAAFPMLPRSFRGSSKNSASFLPLGIELAWASSDLVQRFELEIRNRFCSQVARIREMGWKWYINARILFIGCVEVHSFKCSALFVVGWRRTFRYMDFSTWIQCQLQDSPKGVSVRDCLWTIWDYVTWSEIQKLQNYLVVKALEQQKFS